MARTPTDEILLTIKAVKQMQADLTTLAKVVEALGKRLVHLETRLNVPAKSERSK